ncbi:MAG: hypothetical protein JWQ04_1184, partial [Pedosphaera sp.]|nr:hypothetical protein [Pedosphaera sp.]
PDPKTGIGRIMLKAPSAPEVYVDETLTLILGQFIRSAVKPATNGYHGAHLTGPLGFDLVSQPLGATKPVLIAVRADKIPYSYQVAQFFPKHPLGGNSAVQSEIQARPIGTNAFEVYLSPPPGISAADYLAWSDQFADDFNAIHEASKRPYARMDGDYENPAAVPIPNFVCVRTTAQTIAQRAQCYLLLNQPEQALREMLLLRDLCRLMEPRPTGRPMTLVAAMINSAVTGLYVSTLADGLRLQVWREPELAALEEQLKQINLPPLLAQSLDCTRVSSCHVIETLTADNMDRVIAGSDRPQDPWQKLRDPTYRFLKFAPRGWAYQNMATIAQIHQDVSNGIDLTNGCIRPGQAENMAREVQSRFSHPALFACLAGIMVPNYIHATQNVARNQTLANEARVACALERHRLARGLYPETLEPLVPQFIDQLPRDLIGGQPLKYRKEGEQFTLYSIGWNERDDGGLSVMKSDGTGDLTKADWVWPNREKITR